MNINDWVNNKTQLIDNILKFKVNGDNDFHKDIGNYILNKGIKNIDLSKCNLTKVPEFVIKIINNINFLKLNDNDITYIPDIIMDLDLKNLELFEVFMNPIKIKSSIFKDNKEFIRNLYSSENKNYIKNNSSKYKKFIQTTDDAISKYIFNLYNNLDIGQFNFDFRNTDNLIDLISVHKNVKYRNYDYINNNSLHKFIVKSIFNFLYQLSKNPLNYNIKGIDINDIYEMNNNLKEIFTNDNLRKKYINLIENIFLSEFLFNDENAVRLLGKGSYNIAYELSEENNLYIIKQLINLNKSKFESYKEFLISTVLMFHVSNSIPNFIDPICIFNLNKNETKTYDEYEIKNKNIDSPKYVCEFDEKYFFSNSQFIFNKNNTLSQRKTFFNKTNKNVDIDNYYMTINVEYGISLDKYLKTLYNLPEKDINTKVLNIILQIIRAISTAYCKVGFYHGDGHCENILINKFDEPTFIEEFYTNPFFKYKYHKTKEIVTFIDYGMSNLYLNKIKKESPENVITNLSISSHDEMANPVVDIHRMYYSIMNDLYKDFSSQRGSKEKILYIIKLFYIYLGGFYYDDKRINYNSSNNVIEFLIKNDLKTIINGKIYRFNDYYDFNYGYLPSLINGKRRDNINNCFDLYNYFFSQYLNNINKVVIYDNNTELTIELQDDFLQEITSNSQDFKNIVDDIEKNKDKNISLVSENVKYKLNKKLENNDEYKNYINEILNNNDEIYNFLGENIKSIYLSLDLNKNKIINENIEDLNRSFEYIVKSISVYVNNLRKICYYNVLNYYSNNLTLNTLFTNTTNIYNLLNNLINFISKINIPKNSNISMYTKVIKDYIEILNLSKSNIKKPLAAAPKNKYTESILKSKTINELKDILNNLKIKNSKLVDKYINIIKKPLSKFVKQDYIDCILYVINN